LTNCASPSLKNGTFRKGFNFFNMRKLTNLSALALTLAVITFSLPTRAQTATETILNSFSDTGTSAFGPYSGVVFDPAGNLYGTTYSGGTSKAGAVYMLSPVSGGGWQETVLYSFTGGADGSKPYYAGVILDSAGNLYGTTYQGGKLGGCSGAGCGTVFRLAPISGGWQETVLYTFTGGKDGAHPQAGLIFDATGNLYGTTVEGGNLTACNSGCGTAFKLTPTTSGPWQQTVLHSFNGKTDGANPHAGLVFDAAGYLYGTNYWGGAAPACPAADCGTVFRLAPSPTGPWKERVLHAFTNGVDGGNPASSVTFDTAENLYGTTVQGGHLTDCAGLGCGTIYKLTPTTSGAWNGSVIRAFSGPDGVNLVSGVIFDSLGNLYGTAPSGTGSHVDGLVFKFTPHTTGPWSQTVLHGFSGVKGDGKNPQAGVIFDSAGNLYSTTANGGSGGGGTVFEITP
jgi:uncharacterized repeat protein (TIGR03803 family)